MSEADVHDETVESEDTPLAVSEYTPRASSSDITSSQEDTATLEIPSVESDDEEDTLVFNEKHNVWVDTDNNLCYESKDTNPGPIGQVQRGQFLRFPAMKK